MNRTLNPVDRGRRWSTVPMALGGAALLVSLLAATPAQAKEPLRPRGSEPVQGTSKAAPQNNPSARSSSDRGRRVESRGDRGARRGDHHRRSHRRVDREARRHHRDGYAGKHRRHRDYRHRGYGYHYPRYGSYGRYGYSRYGFDRYYRYRHRPYYYAGYYPFSVYSVWGPWWGPNVVVDVGPRRPRAAYGGVMGALDLDVSPEKAKIYVDGDYVGVADEYDGFPSYLWLEEGTYDLAIYHEGYETIFRQYTVRNGLVIDIEDDMERGEAIHPDDHGPTASVHRDRRLRRNAERRDRAERIEQRDMERSDDRSRVALTIWPEDAAVYLNGHFVGTGEEIGALLQGLVVDAGQHSLEVVRPGYETDERTITVAPGQTLELEIDLGGGEL